MADCYLGVRRENSHFVVWKETKKAGDRRSNGSWNCGSPLGRRVFDFSGRKGQGRKTGDWRTETPFLKAPCDRLGREEGMGRVTLHKGCYGSRMFVVKSIFWGKKKRKVVQKKRNQMSIRNPLTL